MIYEESSSAIKNCNTDDEQQAIKPVSPGVELRNGYTESEYELLMALINDLPALFYGYDSNVFEDVAIRIVKLIENARARR